MERYPNLTSAGNLRLGLSSCIGIGTQSRIPMAPNGSFKLTLSKKILTDSKLER